MKAQKNKSALFFMEKNYQYYNQLFKGKQLPLAFLDLDLLDQNIDEISKRSTHGTIRIASKSIRCSYVLKRILDSNPIFKGIMTFMPQEAIWLLDNGFDDLLMGYPTVNISNIESFCKATKSGKRIIPMVDDIEHLQLIQTAAKKYEIIQPICIDIDMSSDFPGIHFGVYRSPINSLNKFKKLIDELGKFPNIHLEGIMGYEAQIAGIGTNDPYMGLKNYAVKMMRNLSINELAKRRTDCIKYAQSKGHTLPLINGGGTGSIESTLKEQYITEVTVGSGFFSPGLFDYYENFKHQPAAGFACEIVRIPKKGMFTLMGGGYIASGGIGLAKQPTPYLPKGISLVQNEGCGEVQTPVIYNGKEKLNIGDTLLFRHAKAGELCERFDKIHLISKGAITQTTPTYRGEGKCFV